MEVQQPPGARPEEPTPIEQGYQEFIKRKINEFLGPPEFGDVKRWIEERVAGLPEMEVTEAPVTDGENYKQEKTPSDELQKVTSKFLNIEGRHVAIKNPDGTISFEWTQPAVKENESLVTFPTPEGPVTMKTSGLVGVIQDEDGNVLLSVKQESLAQTEKKGLVGTPFQTSAEKAKLILEDGKPEYDANFSKTVAILGGGRSLSDMFATGEFQLTPAAPANANRIEASNVGFMTTVKNPTIREQLVADGKNRWCTPAEGKAIAKSGLMNGFTASALYAAEKPLPQAA